MTYPTDRSFFADDEAARYQAGRHGYAGHDEEESNWEREHYGMKWSDDEQALVIDGIDNYFSQRAARPSDAAQLPTLPEIDDLDEDNRTSADNQWSGPDRDARNAWWFDPTKEKHMTPELKRLLTRAKQLDIPAVDARDLKQLRLWVERKEAALPQAASDSVI